MRVHVLAALSLVLAGCASSGAKIDTTQLNELRKGQTTVADVVRRYGRPNFLSKNWDGTQTAAYANTEGRSDAGALLPLVGTVVAGAESGIDSVIFYFDAKGVLTDYRTKQTAPARPAPDVPAGTTAGTTAGGTAGATAKAAPTQTDSSAKTRPAATPSSTNTLRWPSSLLPSSDKRDPNQH